MFDSKIDIIEEVKFDGENEVKIKAGGWVWCGSKRKDFWHPESDWESRLVAGVLMRTWTVQFSRVIGFEIEEDGKWVAVWCQGNDFDSKEEREKSANAYANFIETEGKKIAEAIDNGKTLSEINDIIDNGHTGNTFGVALHYGICNATDKEKAEVVRKEHNLKYGVEGDEGTVNPAILTIG